MNFIHEHAIVASNAIFVSRRDGLRMGLQSRLDRITSGRVWRPVLQLILTQIIAQFAVVADSI